MIDGRSFLDVFKSIVDAHRDKDAIVTEGRHKVTYGQLLSKACGIAKLLRDLGAEPVGIGITKSAEYIASMLGIWLARAAFVPIDPLLPKERAQYIINQSKIRFALVSESGGSTLSALGVKTVPID